MTAHAGSYSAGIGTGENYFGATACGNITITGGIVNAYGGGLGAGIGAGRCLRHQEGAVISVGFLSSERALSGSSPDTYSKKYKCGTGFPVPHYLSFCHHAAAPGLFTRFRSVRSVITPRYATRSGGYPGSPLLPPLRSYRRTPVSSRSRCPTAGAWLSPSRWRPSRSPTASGPGPGS